MLVRGGLGEHTAMSYAPSRHENRTARSASESFPCTPLLYFSTELIHLSWAGPLFLLNLHPHKKENKILQFIDFSAAHSALGVVGSKDGGFSLHYSPRDVW